MAGTGKRSRPLRSLRRGILRLGGPITRKRHGRIYVWRRVVAGRIDERGYRRRPQGIDAITLDALPARVPGATYRELEPVAPDVSPPPGWVAPKHCHDDGEVEWDRTPSLGLAERGRGVVEIPGGAVFGEPGIYGPDPDGVLMDANAMWPSDEHFLLRAAVRSRSVGTEQLGGVTMSVMAHNDNYCHWLLQGLPRLELLRRAFGLEADRILVREGPAQTVDALVRLGVSRERMVFLQRHSPVYRCETLRAASGPTFRELGEDWVVEFLHELYLPDPPRPGSRRLYVQRGVANRSVLNEEDVLELLVPAGFEPVSMEGRTIPEQAALFASAEAVVSTHGAALANLAFCRPGTQVIELAGANTARTGFARLCWRRGMHHEFVVGTEPTAGGRWWTWLIDAATSVDVPELRRTLGGLGLL